MIDSTLLDAMKQAADCLEAAGGVDDAIRIREFADERLHSANAKPSDWVIWETTFRVSDVEAVIEQEYMDEYVMWDELSISQKRELLDEFSGDIGDALECGTLSNWSSDMSEGISGMMEKLKTIPPDH